MREVASYWKRVLRRTWTDSLRFIGTSPWRMAVGVTIILITVNWYGKWRGDALAFDQLDWYIVQAKVLVFAIVVAFAVMLLKTPYRLEAEARAAAEAERSGLDAEIHRLSRCVDDASAACALADSYWNELKAGEKRRIEWSAGEADVPTRADIWRQRVFARLEKEFGLSVAHRFNRGSTHPISSPLHDHIARVEHLDDIVREIRSGQLRSISGA